MSAIPDLRPSPIAGRWYPGDPAHLTRLVDGYIHDAVLPPLAGEVVAVISPHAGYRYSGRTAGHSFRALLGRQVDVVAVLSPLHTYHPGALLTSAHRAYQTPLGAVEIDRALVERLDTLLRARGSAGLNAVANDEEHSLEIELPFLQRALGAPFKLVPVMLRSQQFATANSLGQALAELLTGRNALIVASSDLSHFYTENVANELDTVMLANIERFSPEGVLEAEYTQSGFACGVGAIAAALWAARGLGADRAQVVHHSTSADETHDPGEVVGYGAAVVTRPV